MIHSSTGKGAVYVIGLGTRLIAQITLESNYLLSQVDKIFHLESDHKVSEYIVSIGREEVNLSTLYEDGRLRESVYQEVCDTVVEFAESGYQCAYLAPGNPVFLNSIVYKLKESTTKLGLPFLVFPGVSSIDTLLNDTFLPVGITGLQCYEATHFINAKPAIDKKVPLLLFQPGVVSMYDIHFAKGAYFEGVKILQDYLIELYGADQKWILLKSAMTVDDSPYESEGLLIDLFGEAPNMDLGTLLIPGNWDEKSFIG